MKSILIVLFFVSFFPLSSALAQQEVQLEKNIRNRGSLARSKVKKQNNDQRYKHLKIFSDALHVIETSYVHEVSTEKLIQGAIKGMIKELDPHSHFLSADELKAFKKEARGRFRGFGMELEIKNKQLIVISVLENSPAKKAGLKPGHIIIKINNQKTATLNKKEINELLKSKKQVEVHISIRDPGSKTTGQIKLRPRIIDVQSVSYQDLGDRALYIRINTFTERTLREIRKIISKYATNYNEAAYTNLKPKGFIDSPSKDHIGINGLILDLRGNPGGLFEPAVKVADLFIKKGIIVSIKGRNHEQTFKAFSHGTLPDFPMLVLIDAYSASSAEILAGALKENKRAILLGGKSFGKGSVQSLIPTSHGNAVKLTIAHYYTPKGHSIHEQGVHPDIKLKVKESTNSEDTDFYQAVYLLKMFRFFSSSLSLPFDF